MRLLRRAALAILFVALMLAVLAPAAQASRTLRVSASISNHHPRQYTTVTARCRAHDQNGRAIKGVRCVFTWHYKTISHAIVRRTNSRGRCSSTRYISGATIGYKVVIRIHCTWRGQTKNCSTWFIPT